MENNPSGAEPNVEAQQLPDNPPRQVHRATGRRRALLAIAALLGLAAACANLAARRSPSSHDSSVSCEQPPTPVSVQRIILAPPFDLSNSVVPADQILDGGPGKDGIPALNKPRAMAADDADYLKADDRVVGVVIRSEARAYPLRIMAWHEIANDVLGDTPIAVTYCPLCDSAAVFDRRSNGAAREYGVSGMLYNSNMLLYDRGADQESLFSQVMAQGVTGPRAKEAFRALPVELTDWSSWRGRHPQTTVLSPDTGHPRDYARNPYEGFLTTPDLAFPARPQSDRLPVKSLVLGIWSGTTSRAYSLQSLVKGPSPRHEELDGLKFTLEHDGRPSTARIKEAEEGLSWMYSLWFAWYAMRPDTQLAGDP
jgi:hypothetical protein